MTYPGINYAGPYSTTNMDIKTGIRFAVIPMQEIQEAWCISCEQDFNEDIDPVGEYYNDEGYECTRQCDDSDIIITKSPYFTYAQFCSPCFPGGCYLLEPLDEPIQNNKCYCFGEDWFEDNMNPYDIYSVETGQLVKEKTTND